MLLDGAGCPVSENEAFAEPPKHLALARPHIRVSCEGRRVSLTSDALCLAVALATGPIALVQPIFVLELPAVG